ncbi:hypothetical protein VNI00_005174 [Paramarasmius palmivorus]|uniref:Uncharacterized protein n=1 Tax=Paramarasmius palmivorus TaxID=297713 RepID=A0AAW0DHK8_9AGAR
MFLTSALTVGQLTFILRAAIQILSYGGIFLLGFIVLGSAPRVASLQTHDVLNRIVGRETATKQTRKWIFNAIRGRNGDPVSSHRLTLALTLLSTYGLLVSLSDLGFLGLYACHKTETFESRPASVNSTERARAMINTALVNGTDPSTVKYYRCDSSEVVNVGFTNDDTLSVCTSWHNSTFADPSVFTGFNTTDSEVLLPRYLRHFNDSGPRAGLFDFNTYRMGFGSTLITNATIRNGLVVEPHESGLKVLLGVPDLNPRQSVKLERAMTLEVEVGCMTVGIMSSHDPDAIGNGLDYFSEKDDWRAYAGPNNLREVLSKMADDVRSYYSPLFNSSLDDGYRTINSTGARFTESPRIDKFNLPDIGNSTDGRDIGDWIEGNCTESLRRQLQLDASMITSMDTGFSSTCKLVALSGMLAEEGDLVQVASKMVCASTTQINMVSGTVSTSEGGQVVVNMTRLPSDLNQLRADYFDTIVGPNGTDYQPFAPMLRYTLSDNPNGPTSHYIYNKRPLVNSADMGTGSPGVILASIGTAMLDLSELSSSTAQSGLLSLSTPDNVVSLAPKTASEWFGQAGASLTLNSLVYNGWIAESSAVLLVTDTGGDAGICYTTPYAIGFVPLLIAAIFVALWMVTLLITGRAAGTKTLEGYYGGLKPYWGVVCPTTPAHDAILAWETVPGPHLQLVSPGQTFVIGTMNTAAGHLKSPPPSTPMDKSYFQ